MQFEALSKRSVLILSKTFVYFYSCSDCIISTNFRTQEPHPALKHTVCGSQQSFSNTSNML